jgi:hypothetical protein
MRDVLVDQHGDFRCPNCHGRHFDHKRTLRGKVAAGAVILPAALLVPKRMKCLGCGTYAKTGSAQQWHDAPPPAPTASVVRTDPLTKDYGAVPFWLAATTANEAITASALMRVFPSFELVQREAIARQLAAGTSVQVGKVAPAQAAAVIAQLAALGITAEV